jgi:glucokinase
MPQASPDRLLLAADVGGTNLNLALLYERQGKFELVRRWDGATHRETSFLEPVQRFLKEAAREGLLTRPAMACLSVAGPVRGTQVHLPNAPWDIDGLELEAALGMPVHLMNDFTAVSYGVLLLDPEDSRQLVPLPHPDGPAPAPAPQGTALIVGAGTGLGVGYVTRAGSRPRAFPSEGGHIGLPITDPETIALWQHLAAGLPGPPDAETAVSGPGLANIYGFLIHSGRFPRTPLAAALLDLPPADRPAAIAGHAREDAACGRAMELFVELYARVCAELCAVFIPTGGLYLAGGIAAKNAPWFLDGHRFMTAFDRNHRPHIDGITRATPVFMVRDYDISLYGAAHAGCLAPEA